MKRLLGCVTALLCLCSVALAVETQTEYKAYGTQTTDANSSFTLTFKNGSTDGQTVTVHHYVRLESINNVKGVYVLFNDNGTSPTVSLTHFSVYVPKDTYREVWFRDGMAGLNTLRVFNGDGATSGRLQAWGR